MSSTNGYNPNVWLARYAKDLGEPKGKMLVLAPNNDPFNTGTKTHLKDAQWFAHLHERVGYRGIHLRRLHYRAYDAGLENAEGEHYPNTEKQWNELQNASRHARYLGLVDPADFTDNRSPSPELNVSGLPYVPEPAYEIDAENGLVGWHLPSIQTSLKGSVNVAANHSVTGYYYSHELQPNLIEVWSEKSGDDATLIPLARQYGFNYCPGTGFQSVTNIRQMFRRARRTGKPTRILYISDFDPAGMGMPVQVGRQTQYAFWQLEELAGEEAPNVKLEPIALTHDQVVDWRLPRKPLKAGYEDWEDRFGEGAVEVDALEARHPGRLTHLVRERVSELQDNDLRQRISSAREEAERQVHAAVEEAVARHQGRAQETAAEFDEVAERYRERLETLSAEFEEEVGPIREQFQAQKEAFEADLESLEVGIPDLPEGVAPDEANGWMFDSSRDFLKQTQEFRRRQRRL